MEDKKYFVCFDNSSMDYYYDDHVRNPETDTNLETVFSEDDAVLAIVDQQNNYLNFLIEG